MKTYNECKGLTSEEAREYLLSMFAGYKKRKNDNNLYHPNDNVPKILIETYYGCFGKVEYSVLEDRFRKKYIENENKLEDIHSKAEKDGMSVLYDYISSIALDEKIEIYKLLKLHELLYSKVPYKEFGGKLRNEDVYLPYTGTNTMEWSFVPQAIINLQSYTNDIVKEGRILRMNSDPNKIIDYIDKCIDLKCKLIKIHPFKDGNGRTIRAFINILFKLAGVPLVYVKSSERYEYNKAMNKANNDNDISYIKTFYYYKICDSIIELDIKIPQENKEKVKSING